MTNKSVSDFVAATMNAVLNSEEHKSLFGSNYVKTAQSVTRHSDKDPGSKCDGVLARGECLKCHKTFDMSNADDNAAKDGSSEENDSCMADDDADDNDAADGSSDECAADDEKVSSAFDIAIDGLLTASAALDSVGLEKTSTLSLKIASFVVEAKKKEKAKKDEKKSGKSSSNSKGKKPNPFAKKPAKKDEKKSGKSSSTSSSSSKKPAKKDEKSSSKKK
jgi:hypothetical protein